MPAMPMADSRPPIVVGIRQTSSAISTVTDRTVPGIGGDRPKRHADDQEDDRHAREQDRQSEFVRRLLALGAFDERDHPVEEGRARRRRDAHLDPVGENRRAAGHGRAVAAGFADHRRGFTGDGGFVDRGDAFDDFAVGQDDLACLDQHDVADLEVERIHRLAYSAAARGIDEPFGHRVRTRAAQSIGLRLATAFGDGFGEIGEQHREPQPRGDLAAEQSRAVWVARSRTNRIVTTTETASVTKMTGLRISVRGSSLATASTVARPIMAPSKRPGASAFEDIVDGLRQKVLPASIRKCSTIGPSASAGKYCRR